MQKNNFTAEELKCPCCGLLNTDPDFLELLNAARNLDGEPWIIESGTRCTKHNKEVGSTSTNHTTGKAVDIRERNQTRQYEIVKCCMLCGLFGIGVRPSGIHADSNHDRPTLWTYQEPYPETFSLHRS